MSEIKLKMVRALRAGSYDGHRRRIGAVFPVRVDAQEAWFEEAGPASADVEFPTQLAGAQALAGKSFIDVMRELGKPQAPAPVTPKPITLAEAQAAAALPVDADLA